jgi:DNA-directed RNA polymerase subunit RPC12/RpoP
MATVFLKFVPEDRIGEREIVETGVMMLGLEGDNVHCGLCGREMMHDVPIRTMKVDLVYRCAVCGGLNELPSDA